MELDELRKEMLVAIESMKERKSSVNRGFVWGILWVAHRLGFEDVKTRANEIMKEMKEDEL